MADIREQDLALKTTIADTDWIRLVTPTGNHRMTVGQFKDLIGYTALQQRTQELEENIDGFKYKSVELTLSGNWTSASSFGPVEIQKVGNVVSLSGVVSGGAVGSRITVIPAGMRPKKPLRVIVPSSSPTDNTAIQINVDGSLNHSFGNTTNLSLAGITYITE